MANRNLKREITDIFSNIGYDDYDACESIFNCMSPENQQKFLKKHGYKDLGYAYDDDRELAYDLVYAMNDEELANCKEIADELKRDNSDENDEKSQDTTTPDSYKSSKIGGATLWRWSVVLGGKTALNRLQRDYEFAQEMFNLLSPENQQKFLNKGFHSRYTYKNFNDFCNKYPFNLPAHILDFIASIDSVEEMKKIIDLFKSHGYWK